MLSNKSIFNSYKSDFSDLEYLRNLFLTQTFPYLVSFLLLIKKLGADPNGFVLHQCDSFYHVANS